MRSNRAKRPIIKQLEKHTEEGLMEVKFTFNKKLYTRRHIISKAELEVMKKNLELHGQDAVNTILWKTSAYFMTNTSAALIADAAVDYIKEYHIPTPPAPKLGEALSEIINRVKSE